MKLARIAFPLVCLGCSLTGAAQTPAFIEPEAFVSSKQAVAIKLLDGNQNALWSGTKVRWAFVKTGMVQENRDDLSDWLDASGTFQCPIPGPGVVMLGVDFAPKLETLSADALRPLLEKSTLIPAKTVTVRHYRAAITLFRSSQDDPGSTIATTETSLSSSIHPLMDPTRFTLGGELPYELVMRGGEVEDGIVKITSVTSGTTLKLPTRRGGLGFFKPSESGIHRISYQVARPLHGDPDAQFEVFSTTLTFSVGGHQ